jgi:ArsR family transcriptional regulator
VAATRARWPIATQEHTVNQPVHGFKAEFFKALGHPVRLVILGHLRAGEKSVNELQALLGIDQSSVSQQLAILRNRNIVEARKEGTTVYYRARPDDPPTARRGPRDLQ